MSRGGGLYSECIFKTVEKKIYYMRGSQLLMHQRAAGEAGAHFQSCMKCLV